MIEPHDLTNADAETLIEVAGSGIATAIDSAHRLLMIRGLTSVEAGNVVAHVIGIRPAETGWTVDEIKHIVAIRALVASGVIEA
jgi:hypothetical protein